MFGQCLPIASTADNLDTFFYAGLAQAGSA